MNNEKMKQIECPFCEYREKEYWFQFRLKVIGDSIKHTLAYMVGELICEFIESFIAFNLN